MANPLKQFEIQPLVPIEIAGIDISFTNSSLWMMVGVALSFILFQLASARTSIIPNRWQVLGEGAYSFIANMVRENTGTKGMIYFPLIFTLFMVVLLGNSLGMIPGSFTFTSQLVVTAALALLIFFIVLLVGIFKHGVHFFELFLPPGAPLWLSPLIVPIEVISFLVRPVTLSVRLFANMMAGHILLKVVAGFSVGMASLGLGGYLLGIAPMAFNVLLIGFEFLIAFLQAYVFAILSCIYLKDAVEIAH